MLRIKVKELAKKKAHAEGRSITKYVIAKESGLAFNTVDGYWENSIVRIDLPVAEKLCRYFDVSLGELIVEEEASPEAMAV